MRKIAEGGISFLLLGETGARVILSAEGAKDPLLTTEPIHSTTVLP